MLSVEDALARILKMVSVLEPVQIPILDALDQILSADVFSSMDIPPLPNSAMDGYAIISLDTKNKIDTDIKKVFSRIKNNSEVILKCDIESNEYLIIDQILEYSNRIKMLIIEFHWIDKNEMMFVESVKKLQSKFEIIHIHANNHFQTLKNGLPIILEITLLNKKFSPNKIEYVDDFPIKGLDFPNIKRRSMKSIDSTVNQNTSNHG